MYVYMDMILKIYICMYNYANGLAIATGALGKYRAEDLDMSPKPMGLAPGAKCLSVCMRIISDAWEIYHGETNREKFTVPGSIGITIRFTTL